MTLSWLNRRTVKWLALTTMLIDHVGGSLTRLYPDMYDQTLILRCIGRLAFPLFAFQMGLTFAKTKDLPKLLKNLFILALLSEIPYDMALKMQWDASSQNVVWNFLLVGIVLWSKAYIAEKYPQVKNHILPVFFALGLGLIAEYAGVDYGLRGFLLILIFSLGTEKLSRSLSPLILFEDWWVKFSLLLLPFVIYAYDDRPIKFDKWEGTFYHYFYPLHLLVLYFVFN